MSDDPVRVDALMKELLSLNRTESVAAALPQSPQEMEQRRRKRKKVRQELVLTLSHRCL